MEKRPVPQASLGDVARAAGVSVTSAGCALRNLPGVSEKTRRRIARIARQLKYFPDPLLTSRMTGIRLAAAKDLLPVVWLNTAREKDAWHRYTFLSPYREGAEQRLHELGYRLEEIWTRAPGFSMRRIAHIIDNQGIEGVLVTEPAKHVRLNWSRLAAVSIGGGLFAPGLHRATTDTGANLALSYKSLRRIGYRRIGLCLTEEADRLSRHATRSLALYFNSTVAQSRRVHPLFTPFFMKPSADSRLVAAWLKKERPDAVICLSSKMVGWIEAAGFRVPQDIAVAHLAIEDDVADWAGIYANKREVGRQAADKVVSLIQHRLFGLPRLASTTTVPGEWRDGCTVLRAKS